MKANGYLAYHGPSELDGNPIKVIVTGNYRPSANSKTGDMLQVWIMPADVKPSETVKTGQDSSVCGDCPARPKNGGKCYVNTWQAPNRTWNASYPNQADNPRNAPVRLGAWGDPAAIPIGVLKDILGRSPKHTGYTHQWRNNPELAEIVMASVDNESEAIEASELGWRYFRVLHKGDTLGSGEILCPASKEAGKKVTCADCGLCAGNSRKAKNVAIYQHGGRK